MIVKVEPLIAVTVPEMAGTLGIWPFFRPMPAQNPGFWIWFWFVSAKAGVIRAKPRKRAAIAIKEEYFFIDKLNTLLWVGSTRPIYIVLRFDWSFSCMVTDYLGGFGQEAFFVGIMVILFLFE